MVLSEGYVNTSVNFFLVTYGNNFLRSLFEQMYGYQWYYTFCATSCEKNNDIKYIENTASEHVIQFKGEKQNLSCQYYNSLQVATLNSILLLRQ